MLIKSRRLQQKPKPLHVQLQADHHDEEYEDDSNRSPEPFGSQVLLYLPKLGALSRRIGRTGANPSIHGILRKGFQPKAAAAVQRLIAQPLSSND